MITKDQLGILQDIFSESDTNWLLNHISIRSLGGRNFVIEVDKGELPGLRRTVRGRS